MVDEALYKKAKWLSRRGLLELDIILSKFLSSTLFETLTHQELLTYLKILNWQDHDFLQILQDTKLVDDIDTINIIGKIKFCSRMKPD